MQSGDDVSSASLSPSPSLSLISSTSTFSSASSSSSSSSSSSTSSSSPMSMEQSALSAEPPEQQMQTSEVSNSSSASLSTLDGVQIEEYQEQPTASSRDFSTLLMCRRCLKARRMPAGLSSLSSGSWTCAEAWWSSRIGDCSAAEELLSWPSGEPVKWTGLPRAFVERSSLHESFYHQLHGHLEAKGTLVHSEFPSYRGIPIELFVIHSYLNDERSLYHLDAEQWDRLFNDLGLGSEEEQKRGQLRELKHVVRDVVENLLRDFIFDLEKCPANVDTRKFRLPEAPNAVKRLKLTLQEDDHGNAQVLAKLDELVQLTKQTREEMKKSGRNDKELSMLREDFNAGNEVLAQAVGLVLADQVQHKYVYRAPRTQQQKNAKRKEAKREEAAREAAALLLQEKEAALQEKEAALRQVLLAAQQQTPTTTTTTTTTTARC